jgi:hypothetical protein
MEWIRSDSCASFWSRSKARRRNSLTGTAFSPGAPRRTEILPSGVTKVRKEIMVVVRFSVLTGLRERSAQTLRVKRQAVSSWNWVSCGEEAGGVRAGFASRNWADPASKGLNDDPRVDILECCARTDTDDRRTEMRIAPVYHGLAARVGRRRACALDLDAAPASSCPSDSTTRWPELQA